MKQVEQKKRPGIARGLGMVFYWIGCGYGILSIPTAVWVFFDWWCERGPSIAPFLLAAICLGIGLGFWLIGRAARYFLKGD